MALTDILKSFTRASVLAASLYNCGGKETETVYPCRTTADCTSGTCVGGYCESPNDSGEKAFSCQEVYDFCLRGIRNEGYSDYMLEIRMNSIEQMKNYCENACDEYSSIRDQPNYECAVTACQLELIDCEEHSDFARQNLIRLDQCLSINGWDCERDNDTGSGCR